MEVISLFLKKKSSNNDESLTSSSWIAMTSFHANIKVKTLWAHSKIETPLSFFLCITVAASEKPAWRSSKKPAQLEIERSFFFRLLKKLFSRAVYVNFLEWKRRKKNGQFSVANGNFVWRDHQFYEVFGKWENRQVSWSGLVPQIFWQVSFR